MKSGRALYEVTCHLARDPNLYVASKVICGLSELARHRDIGLRFVVGSEGYGLHREESGACLILEVREPGVQSSPSVIAVDNSDHSDDFSVDILDACDVYLKRSFYRPDLHRLPQQSAHKVRPFGLNFPCRSLSSTVRVLGSILPRMAVRRWRKRRPGDISLVRALRSYLALPTSMEFELSPEVPVEPRIVFQTRVWEEGETGVDDHRVFNEERVDLIRTLRGHFGDRFLGGLVPTEHARRHYPDAITLLASRRGPYIRWMRENLIGVYTRGLHHSLAYKLPEYLAAAQCIVAHPLRNELPVPIREGEHYLPFRTTKECIDACQVLLDDRELATRMRRANSSYYRQHVEPGAHILSCLSQPQFGTGGELPVHRVVDLDKSCHVEHPSPDLRLVGDDDPREPRHGESAKGLVPPASAQ